MKLLKKINISWGFMLETAEERVKLLKAGLTGEEIEELYIENNNFKIVRNKLAIEFDH